MTVDEILAWAGADGERAARWLRELITASGIELDERPRAGWKALAYHHPDAGYVGGIFPRPGRAELVIEHGASLEGFDDVFDEVGGQIAKVLVSAVPDARSEAIVDALLAEIALRSAP